MANKSERLLILPSFYLKKTKEAYEREKKKKTDSVKDLPVLSRSLPIPVPRDRTGFVANRQEIGATSSSFNLELVTNTSDVTDATNVTDVSGITDFTDVSDITDFIGVTDVINETNVTSQAYTIELFGSEAFCGPNSSLFCSNSTVLSCDSCNAPLAVIFAIFVALGGFMIVVGNLLVVWSVLQTKKKTNFDVVKISLAVTDLITGVEIFTVCLPNFVWSINSSPDSIKQKAILSINSWRAIMAGFFYVLAITSSIFHLLLLSVERLYAVRFPLKHRLQRKRTILIGIASVWMIGCLATSIPLIFKDVIEYAYDHVLYLYYPTGYYQGTNSSYSLLAALMAIFYGIPYILTTVLTTTTGILIRLTLRRSRELHSPHVSLKQAAKEESAVFVTFTLMVVGFTVSYLPALIVVSLFYSGQLNSENYAAPYLISFYLSMTSSLVNVIIYSLRDKSFQSSTALIIHKLCKCRPITFEEGESAKSTRVTSMNN